MHALSACRNAARGVAAGGSRRLTMAANPIKTSFRRYIMSAKKTSTAPKAKKSKAAKEAKPEDGKPAEPKAEEAKSADPKGEEAKASAKTSKAKKKAEAKPKKLSAIDAAAKVLGEAGEPMNCQDMIKAMAEKGYWSSPGGKTPAATLYSAILRELQTKGNDARFKKTERGKFAVGKAS
jgi:HB1, ASXL, restriction endonuclease HTH domain